MAAACGFDCCLFDEGPDPALVLSSSPASVVSTHGFASSASLFFSMFGGLLLFSFFLVVAGLIFVIGTHLWCLVTPVVVARSRRELELRDT